MKVYEVKANIYTRVIARDENEAIRQAQSLWSGLNVDVFTATEDTEAIGD